MRKNGKTEDGGSIRPEGSTAGDPDGQKTFFQLMLTLFLDFYARREIRCREWN